MTISISQYINITSGVGGGAVVNRRNFFGRIFTTNPLVPTGTVLQFTGGDASTLLAEVGDYFGTTSEEYLRSLYYFSYVSKRIVKAQGISFARWVDVATAPNIFGAQGATTGLGQFTGLTTGSIVITLGGVALTLTGLDFSAAGSLAAVATIIQTAVRTGTGTQFTAATVTYDAQRASFTLIGGSAVAATVSVDNAGSGIPIASLLGWLTGAILSNGAVVQTITEVLDESSASNNNFGSFLFTYAAALTQSEIQEASDWNAAQNVVYQYYVAVAKADLATYSAALYNNAGTGLHQLTTGEFPEMAPMAFMATTNYNTRNSTKNYMFQPTNLTPQVTSDADYTLYNTLRVNFYGVTQTAGQQIAFYQRGILMGIGTAPVDMNTYANEMWLKDAAAAEIMQLMLGLDEIPANTKGEGQILTVLQKIISEALFNGVISVGKLLNTTQILTITEITGDENAWQQVQSIGYWIDCAIVQVTVDDRIEYKAVYTLVYSKDDVIRSVSGTHVLI